MSVIIIHALRKFAFVKNIILNDIPVSYTHLDVYKRQILDMLTYYLQHQEEVVTRRTKYELNKAEERAHILEGLLIALDNICLLYTSLFLNVFLLMLQQILSV